MKRRTPPIGPAIALVLAFPLCALWIAQRAKPLPPVITHPIPQSPADWAALEAQAHAGAEKESHP